MISIVWWYLLGGVHGTGLFLYVYMYIVHVLKKVLIFGSNHMELWDEKSSYITKTKLHNVI